MPRIRADVISDVDNEEMVISWVLLRFRKSFLDVNHVDALDNAMSVDILSVGKE